MKNQGKLVQTQSGHLGRTFDKDGLVNGKVKVYILHETLNPKRDLNGVPMKLLCDPSTLTIKGFID